MAHACLLLWPMMSFSRGNEKYYLGHTSINQSKLPWPAGVVQELTVVKTVVVRRIVLLKRNVLISTAEFPVLGCELDGEACIFEYFCL